MYYSEQIPKFKEVYKQIKDLLKQRDQIVRDMMPDIKKALLSKMDWNSVIINSFDASSKSILMSVENPEEGDRVRYVFAVDIRDGDEFWLNLQFREDFSKCKSY